MRASESEELEETLRGLLASRQAEVGVAVIVNGADTIVVNNDRRYPLMSVFKFHQALATAHYMEKKGLPLSTLVSIQEADLKANTYSPLRDKYPEGELSLSVAELLEYTLLLSDKSVCLGKKIACLGEKRADETYRAMTAKSGGFVRKPAECG